MTNSERGERSKRKIDYIAVVNLGDNYLAHPNPNPWGMDAEPEGSPVEVIEGVQRLRNNEPYRSHLEGVPIIGICYDGHDIPKGVQREFEGAFGEEFEVGTPDKIEKRFPSSF